MARGYTQQKGIDYNETFAPVAKLVTIRCFFALAALREWPVHQMNVKTAFLCAPIDTDVHLKPPPGLVIGSRFERPALKLLKSLYGLKQSPALWRECLTKYLIGLGFRVSWKLHVVTRAILQEGSGELRHARC